jgi:hypothetical protein
MEKKFEQALRAKVRQILKEAFPSFSGYEFGPDEDDEEKPSAEPKYTTAKATGGAELETIGKELGVTRERVRQLIPVAMEKFKKLHPEAEGPAIKDLEDTVALAVEDYIEYLKSSGELNLQDVWLLRQHPEMVADLEEFRDKFLPDYLDTLIRKTQTQRLMKKPPAMKKGA